jgi:hypothetical protein
MRNAASNRSRQSRSEETKKRIREKLKGRKFSKETRKRMSLAHIGKTYLTNRT